MSCWHFGLRKKLLPYVEGGLEPWDVERVERHLLDCEWCRGLFVRLRSGHRWAQQLPSLVPEFATMNLVVEGGSSYRSGGRVWLDWFDRLTTTRGVAVLATVVVLQLGLLVASNRRLLFGQRGGASAVVGALDLSEFHQLGIRDLKLNTEPHIATQGYVRNVHADEEEGTVAFRLFEDRSGSGPFVVCEIMSPISMPAPREGSYVRVYGVARYDAQTQRNWYEVNPVLNIAPLKPGNRE
ncbi:MAG: zf-HC2 domain-containing protein [Terriglobia bacterium]